jgi:hypothetical protein
MMMIGLLVKFWGGVDSEIPHSAYMIVARGADAMFATDDSGSGDSVFLTLAGIAGGCCCCLGILFLLTLL